MTQKALEEIVLSNRVIVRQLREVISNRSQCSCPCHNDQQREDNNKRLKELEDKLEESDNLIRAFLDKQCEHETEIEKLQSANNDLETRLEELKELASKDDQQSSIESNDNAGEGEPASKVTECNSTGERVFSEESKGSTNRVSDVTNLHESNEGPDAAARGSKVIAKGDGITKPNFHKSKQQVRDEFGEASSSTTEIAKLPDQNVTQVLQLHDQFTIDIQQWNLKAQSEMDRAAREAPGPINGVATVICLDISASMLDNGAWNHAYQFIMEYIEGLEMMTTNYRITEEHVAFVTFGNKTEVVERLTNNYAKIRNAFNNVKVGGPSPMFGGLGMSDSALYLSKGLYDLNGVVVFKKVVLITDGYPTDVCKIAGPDTVSRPEDESREASILDLCQNICDAGSDLFCVPCGNANMEFLTKMVQKSDGKIVKHTKGKWLSRRTFMTIAAAKHQFDLSPLLPPKKPRDHEQEEMLEIIARSRKKLQDIEIKKSQKMYRDTDNPNLPPVGSRVQRGPDWTRGDRDNYKLGTVIGHSQKGGAIWVEWRGEKIEARYGMEGKYEVLIIDEYLKLSENFIMGVGCEVVPGPQWRGFNTDVDRGMSGTAIKLDLQKGVVQVKWKNGERGVYSYVVGKQEVILADRANNATRESDERVAVPVTQQRKNKNLRTTHRH